MKKDLKKAEILKVCFAVYASALMIQNVLATKQIDIFMFTVTTGVIVSPLVFIIQDVVAEVFGYKESKKMILLGFGMNILGTLLFALAIMLPASQFWANQTAFATILGSTFRISIASFVAYVIGSLANSKIMVGLKNKFPKSLFVRAISSTVVGQFLDNFLFSTIAFVGVLPFGAIASMIVGALIFETIYEVILYPLTKWLIKLVKREVA